MPSGQPQTLFTWIDCDELSRRYVGVDHRNPVGREGRIILRVAPDKVNRPRR